MGEDFDADRGFIMRVFLIVAVLAALLGLPRASAAQTNTAGRHFIQGGPAALPGLGVQVGYVGSRSIYTVEGIFYADGWPSFSRGESTLQVSAGLGAALRPFGIVRTIGNADYAYDIDFGLRFGPSLFFTTNATRPEKNQQFSLFFEPFLRFSTRSRNGRIFFVEAGTQRPLLRAGLWFSL